MSQPLDPSPNPFFMKPFCHNSLYQTIYQTVFFTFSQFAEFCTWTFLHLLPFLHTPHSLFWFVPQGIKFSQLFLSKPYFCKFFLTLWTFMRFLNFQCECSQVSKEYLKVEMLLLLQSDLSDNQTCPTTVLLSICLKVRIAKPKLFNLSEHYF